MLSRFLDSRTTAERQLIANILIYTLSAVVVVGAILVFLWLDGWWPQRLIPWVPVDRL